MEKTDFVEDLSPEIVEKLVQLIAFCAKNKFDEVAITKAMSVVLIIRESPMLAEILQNSRIERGQEKLSVSLINDPQRESIYQAALLVDNIRKMFSEKVLDDDLASKIFLILKNTVLKREEVNSMNHQEREAKQQEALHYIKKTFPTSNEEKKLILDLLENPVYGNLVLENRVTGIKALVVIDQNMIDLHLFGYYLLKAIKQKFELGDIADVTFEPA